MKSNTYHKQRQPEGYTSASPIPAQEELRQFYAEQYYQTPQTVSYQVSYDTLELDYKRLKGDALIHAFKAAGVSHGRFLDIGAGEGFLMHVAHEHGFSVCGIDFSAFGVEKFFPELSDRLIAGDIYETMERFAADGTRFEACSLINVLEHVTDPAALLATVDKILSPEGVLAITVPNDYSRVQQLLLREALIDREFWFCPPQHLHYFNAENLPAFCRAMGYTLVDAFSDFPIDLYLLHPKSNYVQDSKNGPAAHRARMLHDTMIATAGLDKYLQYYRAMFEVGVGRDITVLVRRQPA